MVVKSNVAMITNGTKPTASAIKNCRVLSRPCSVDSARDVEA